MQSLAALREIQRIAASVPKEAMLGTTCLALADMVALYIRKAEQAVSLSLSSPRCAEAPPSP